MARCLPLTDMLGPMRQLPSERDLLWLFGTAGLDGGESVLVTGDSATARDFVAGLLYLSGQRQVHILAQPLTHRLSARFQGGPGQERGMLRTAVFTAPMRDHLWLVNRSEARSAGAAAIHGKDAYTAIIRFSRHIASGGQAMPVGWNSSFGGSVQ
jgi:thiosulfate/3-mercaptopyruvate sulfurtransferase